MAMPQSFSGGIVIRYVLPVLWMTSYFYSMGPMGRRTGLALCGLLAPVDVATGQVQATATHWLIGSAGRLACWSASARLGTHCPAGGLGCCWNCGVHFAVCFMQSLPSVIALFCFVAVYHDCTEPCLHNTHIL